MNYFTGVAAFHIGLTAAIHLFAGTGDIVFPIMQVETLHPEIRAIAMVLWHMVSLILLLSTLAIGYFARNSNHALSWPIIASQFGFAFIFVFYNITHFAALFVMPQGTVFVLCPVLMILGHAKVA